MRRVCKRCACRCPVTECHRPAKSPFADLQARLREPRTIWLALVLSGWSCLLLVLQLHFAFLHPCRNYCQDLAQLLDVGLCFCNTCKCMLNHNQHRSDSKCFTTRIAESKLRGQCLRSGMCAQGVWANMQSPCRKCKPKFGDMGHHVACGGRRCVSSACVWQPAVIRQLSSYVYESSVD